MKNIPTTETQPPEGVDQKLLQKKGIYKCQLEYTKYLSQVKDQLNILKSSYYNRLKVIVKNVNNLVIKTL